MDRKTMMEDCPEEFEDRLKEIIDHVEGEVNNIVALLSIGGVDSLADITEAFEIAEVLAKDLY